MNQFQYFVFFSLFLSVSGCAGPNDEIPDLAPVSGYVTFNGEPVIGGTIMFTPEKGRASNATIDENGMYKLFYNSNLPGASVGMHTVSITIVENMDLPVSQQMVIPEKYNTNTTLKVEIPNTDPVTKDFDLESDNSSL